MSLTVNQESTQRLHLLYFRLISSLQSTYHHSKKRFIANRYVPNSFDIIALGLCISLAMLFHTWSFGLACGFGSFIIAYILISAGYLVYILSLAEMSSAFPFPGGSYTIIRCIVGFNTGYLFAICQILLYISCSAYIIYIMTLGIMRLCRVSSVYQGLCVMVYYVLATMLKCFGRRFAWGLTMIMAFGIVVSLLLYISTASSHANISKYAMYYNDPVKHNSYQSIVPGPNTIPSQQGVWFHGGGSKFMESLCSISWIYTGIDSLSYTCNDTRSPQKYPSYGLISTYVITVILSISVILTAVSLPPGINHLSKHPSILSTGYMIGFEADITVYDAISIPIFSYAAYSFTHSYMKIVQALAVANCLPNFMSKTIGFKYQHVPYYGVILGNSIASLICLVIWIEPNFLGYLGDWIILCSMVLNICICYGFYKLRTKFQSAKRSFVSPTGMIGAIFAVIIFSIVIISSIAFQDQRYHGINVAVLALILGGFSGYYQLYLSKKQSFTDEEMKLTFSSLVVKFNMRQQQRIKKGSVHLAGAASPVHGKSRLANIIRKQIVEIHTRQSKLRETRGSISERSKKQGNKLVGETIQSSKLSNKFLSRISKPYATIHPSSKESNRVKTISPNVVSMQSFQNIYYAAYQTIYPTIQSSRRIAFGLSTRHSHGASSRSDGPSSGDSNINPAHQSYNSSMPLKFHSSVRRQNNNSNSINSTSASRRHQIGYFVTPSDSDRKFNITLAPENINHRYPFDSPESNSSSAAISKIASFRRRLSGPDNLSINHINSINHISSINRINPISQINSINHSNSEIDGINNSNHSINLNHGITENNFLPSPNPIVQPKYILRMKRIQSVDESYDGEDDVLPFHNSPHPIPIPREYGHVYGDSASNMTSSVHTSDSLPLATISEVPTVSDLLKHTK